ncbi:MAG TPA: hypothetical protein VH062_19345 [Polyangiaceae bacterium]|jgi:hypothetical protein|nr:hypothetical protein [Polyangiaceae bacterium]
MKPLARRALRIAICAALTFHLAAITVSNLPANTPFGAAIYRPFAWYLTPTGLWQTWDMFTTIPHFLDLDGKLVTADENGVVSRRGPLLPGFARFARTVRVQGTFMRLAFSADSYTSYTRRYRAAICRALLTERHGAPTQVGFELIAKELRSLDDIRKDGRISQPKTYTFGPTPCTP